MPRFEIDLNPVQHITVDAIGQLGARVFYIQGWREADPKTVTIIIEKIQLKALADGVDTLFAEIARKNPGQRTPVVKVEAEKMTITPPVDPLFRAGELGLGYDVATKLIIVLAREVIMEGNSPEEAAEARFWCTPAQLRCLADWGRQVIERGRAVCPLCGQLVDPAGHFCPKKNGHKH
jgi:uncharacterized repeat protein (TIGR03847 family)